MSRTRLIGVGLVLFLVGDALFEYADFYDYRASYPDYDPSKDTDTDMEVECGSKASQGKLVLTCVLQFIRMSDHRLVRLTIASFIYAIYRSGSHSQFYLNDFNTLALRFTDEEVGVEEVDGDGYTLVLPSGATVGHRSLLRYYKQSLNPRYSC